MAKKKPSKPMLRSKSRAVKVFFQDPGQVEVAHDDPDFCDEITFLVWNTSDRRHAIGRVKAFLEKLSKKGVS